MRCSATILLAIGLVLFAASFVEGSDADPLLFLAVADGETLSEQRPDTPVNPASVIKLGTTLWGLDRLGADHRYHTTFGVTGDWDRTAGVVTGDLVIEGGADPDFQWENTFLVAQALNRAGLRTVRGRLVIRGTFWNGWEHGVEKRATDPVERGHRMGRRIIDSLDPRRWTTSHENTWTAMCTRRGLDPAQRPRVAVTGGVAVGGSEPATPIVVHRSNRLADILRRFNVYSNNDIIRIADPFGGEVGLEAFLLDRLAPMSRGIELATASGERRNRMTARQMVALLDAVRNEAEAQGLELEDLLPVIGCDPGATRRMFPALAAAPLTGTVTCKTGTLTSTDGGVAVVAGTFTDAAGIPVLFAIAAPKAGGRLQHWRQLEQRWVMRLMTDRGGAIPRPCGPELPFSDTFAIVDAVGLHDKAVSH
jgi:D-alanyl-D-alanine carboxypeptidase/D-alanyl-D-alanine-endopeptidase (penicillin-binding protein 4)